MVFFSQLLQDVIPVLKLERNAMLSIATDRKRTLSACGIFVGPHIINLVLASLTFPSGFSAIFSRFLFWPMIIPMVSLFLSIILMSFIARKYFSGQGTDIGFFRVISYSSALLWVSVLPFFIAAFGFIDPFGLFNLLWTLSYLWMFGVSYKLLNYYHRLDKHDSFIVVALGIVAYFVIQMILGNFLVGGAYHFLY